MRDKGWRVALLGFVALVVCSVLVVPEFERQRAADDAEDAAERKEAGRSVYASFTDNHAPLPDSARIVELDNRSGRDTEVWAVIELPPAEMDALHETLRQSLRRHGPVQQVMTSEGYPRRASAPTWWTPERDVEAHLLLVGSHQHGATVYVFSRATGRIYFLVFDV